MTELVCGDSFCFARDASSASITYAWGNNMDGALLDASSRLCLPTAVDLGDWRILAAGRAHACLSRAAPTTVFCAGDNSNGQLGQGDTAPHARMLVATGTSGGIDISAYGDTTCVVDDGREVVCWGRNDFGQCGRPGPAPVTAASDVALPGTARLVGVGGRHACAVLDTNQVVCWGRNAYGELGDGTHTDSPTPVFVSGLP